MTWWVAPGYSILNLRPVAGEWPAPLHVLISRTDPFRRVGYGIARFNKQKRTITFECWPRFADVSAGNKAQFPGWPITVNMDDNDGRRPVAWLPELKFNGAKNPVVQVVAEETGEILYTVRVARPRFQPPVYAPGKYTAQAGLHRPDGPKLTGLEAREKNRAGRRVVRF